MSDERVLTDKKSYYNPLHKYDLVYNYLRFYVTIKFLFVCGASLPSEYGPVKYTDGVQWVLLTIS